MPSTEPVLEIVVPGEAVGKKTSPQVIYPAAYSLGLTLGPGARVQGLKDVFRWIQFNAVANPARVASIAAQCVERMVPVVTPPKAHAKWLRGAMKVAARIRAPRPVVPAEHLVRVRTRIFMGRGQMGDLINFEQATWDFLQEAEFITNDFWVNSHDGSERIWTDPENPRVELALFDLGPRVEYRLPFVKVDGLTAAKRSKLPLRFAIVAPEGEPRVDRCQAPNGMSRESLVREADRIWREFHGEQLPDSSRILVDDPALESQSTLHL